MVVRNSFQVTGIALHPDGSEDKKIRYIHEVAVVAAAKDDIAWQTAKLTRHEEKSDPLTDIEENGVELGENDIMIDNGLP